MYAGRNAGEIRNKDLSAEMMLADVVSFVSYISNVVVVVIII